MAKEGLLLGAVFAHNFGYRIKIPSFEAINDLIFAIIVIALEMLLVLSAQPFKFSISHKVSIVRIPYATDFFIF